MFMFVYTRCEGSAIDALVFTDAIMREDMGFSRLADSKY